jgi:hypothetical protein
MLSKSQGGTTCDGLPFTTAFDAELRGLPEAAWVFSWRQMDCSPSCLAKESLREGVQEEDLQGRCSSQSSRTWSSPPKVTSVTTLVVVTGFSYWVTAVG